MKPGSVAPAMAPVSERPQSPGLIVEVQSEDKAEPAATATGRDTDTSHQTIEKTASEEENPNAEQDTEKS